MATNPPELPDRSTALDEVRRLAAAQPPFAALLAGGLNDSEALTRWGVRLLKANRAPEAVTAFRLGVALADKDTGAWNNFGLALDRQGAWPEAAQALERSLSLLRRQPEIWVLLGMVRKKLGDLAGAESAYRAAMGEDAAASTPWQCLGLLKEEQRDFAGAVECFRECIGRGGGNAAVWANLGKLSLQLGRVLPAHQAYATAVKLDGANPLFRSLLARMELLKDLIEDAPVDDAVAKCLDALPPPADGKPATAAGLLLTAFELLNGYGHTAAAVRAGRRRLELEPGNAVLKYQLQAAAGESGLAQSSREFVVEHFDAFAGEFDTKLVQKLDYFVPERLGEVIRAMTPPDRRYDALDAGCGTGLCGRGLRPMARKLSGVDLSPKMLEAAARRGLYDELVCEEIVAFLARSPQAFDLVAAADVLIYIGELRPLFAASAAAIRPGGLLAFSTETLAAGDYELRRSGRFAQSPAYVRSVATQNFEEIHFAEVPIRLEVDQPIPGNLFLFRRR